MNRNEKLIDGVTEDECTDLIYVVCSESFNSSMIEDINYIITENYLVLQVKLSLIYFRLGDFKKAKINMKLAPNVGWKALSPGLSSTVQRLNWKMFEILPQEIHLSDFFDKKYLKGKI